MTNLQPGAFAQAFIDIHKRRCGNCVFHQDGPWCRCVICEDFDRATDRDDGKECKHFQLVRYELTKEAK